MTSDRQQYFLDHHLLLLFSLRNCVLSLSCVDVCECCYFTFTLFFFFFFLFIMMLSSHSLLCLTSFTLLLTFVPIFFFLFPFFIIYTTLCEKKERNLFFFCFSYHRMERTEWYLSFASHMIGLIRLSFQNLRQIFDRVNSSINRL